MGPTPPKESSYSDKKTRSGCAAEVELVHPSTAKVDVVVKVKPTLPHTFQSPAVKEIVVMFLTTLFVRLTALPDNTTLETNSPTLPAAALSLVVVPTMFGWLIVGCALVNNVPLVGNVKAVLPVTVKAVVNAPEKERAPPKVIVDAPLLTPVPPFVADTGSVMVAAAVKPKLVREVAAFATSDKLFVTIKKDDGANVNCENRTGSVSTVTTVAVSNQDVFAFAVPLLTATKVPGLIWAAVS